MHFAARIAAAIALALVAAGPAAAAVHYTIAPHDTLYSIARRFHVPVFVLTQANGLRDPARIRVGDILLIPDAPALQPPGASSAAAQRAGVSARGMVRTYVVRPGDTLYRISRTYGTTVAVLAEANHLVSPHALRAGQVLQVPSGLGVERVPPAIPYSAAARLAPPSGPVRAAAAAPTDPVSGPGEPTRGPASPVASPDGLPERASPVPDGSVSPPSPTPAHPVRAPGSGGAAFGRRASADALRYLGTPYVWGGASRAGVDCSGLVFLVFSPYLPHLGRSSYDQWLMGAAVDRGDLTRGDLVFFNTDGSGASHVGIYIGDGQFVHPAASTRRVVVDRLDAPYYATHYLGARRIL